MAAALPFLQIAGTVMSVVGALNQSSARAEAADYNAAVSERNAGIARQQGAAEAEQTRRMNALRIGSIKAGYAASGVQQEGSVLDVLESSVSQAKLEEQNVMYNAELRAMGFSDSAALSRSQASSARSSGLYDAAGKAILGGAKAYDMFNNKPDGAKAYDTSNNKPGAGTPIPFYGVGASPY